MRVARPPAELAVGRGGLEPRRVRRHDDRRDAVRPAGRFGRRGDDVERGDRRSGVRDERLRTVDDPLAVLETSRRVDLRPRRSRRRAPSGRTRRAPRRERAARASAAFCSSVPNRFSRLPASPTAADSVIATDWSTRPSSSSARHTVTASASDPAVRLGERQPEQPEVAHLLHHIERELLFPVGLGRTRLDDVFSEIPDDAAERCLFVGQIEVHACRKPSTSRMALRSAERWARREATVARAASPVVRGLHGWFARGLWDDCAGVRGLPSPACALRRYRETGDIEDRTAPGPVDDRSPREPICHGPSPSRRCINTVSALSSLTRPIVAGSSSGSPSMPTWPTVNDSSVPPGPHPCRR